MTTTKKKTYRIEVYQTRFPNSTEEEREKLPELVNLELPTNGEIEVTHEKFGKLWTLVGTDTITQEQPTGENSHTDEEQIEEHLLQEVFARWNNGSGQESKSFIRNNQQERAVSLSSGDIVRIEGKAFLCKPIGWKHLQSISY